MTDSFLRLTGIDKSFGPVKVVHSVDLELERGEFVSLLGPSGCGKTTILRMVAGFEAPSSGSIIVDGQDITRVPARARQIGMVFQSYALFPNMNVAGNIGFGLKVAGVSKAQTTARVQELLELIGMKGFEKRFPFELSGGQQQRVSLARALAPRPRMLLLDEPLSALDAQIRVSLRDQIRDIQRELGITTLFVTHDQEEAMSISDRIVIVNAGRVDQVGTPRDIYNRPATRFVANFVGSLNTLEGVVENAVEKRVKLGDDVIALTELPATSKNGDKIALALRPEAVSLGAAGPGEFGITGRVRDVNFLGAIVRLRVKAGESVLELDLFNDPNVPLPKRNETVSLKIATSSVLML